MARIEELLNFGAYLMTAGDEHVRTAVRGAMAP